MIQGMKWHLTINLIIHFLCYNFSINIDETVIAFNGYEIHCPKTLGPLTKIKNHSSFLVVSICSSVILIMYNIVSGFWNVMCVYFCVYLCVNVNCMSCVILWVISWFIFVIGKFVFKTQILQQQKKKNLFNCSVIALKSKHFEFDGTAYLRAYFIIRLFNFCVFRFFFFFAKI